MSAVAKVFVTLLNVAVIAFVLLFAATLHGISAKRERIACHRSGQVECGSKGMVERAVDRLIGGG